LSSPGVENESGRIFARFVVGRSTTNQLFLAINRFAISGASERAEETLISCISWIKRFA